MGGDYYRVATANEGAYDGMRCLRFSRFWILDVYLLGCEEKLSRPHGQRRATRVRSGPLLSWSGGEPILWTSEQENAGWDHFDSSASINVPLPKHPQRPKPFVRKGQLVFVIGDQVLLHA